MTMARTRTKMFVGFLGLLILALAAGVLAQPAGAQVQGSADLSVQKFDFPPTQVAVGEPLFYELNIANLGSETAANAIVTDDLPSNTEFLATISGDCTNMGNTVTCDLGDLAPAEQAVVEFAVCPTAPGTATNTATASSDTPDSDTSNNTDTETTEVTEPAVGACPSQEAPPEPGPTPPNSPQPEPTPPADTPQPEPPQLEEPVADAGLCASGSVAIQAQDFSIACAGGQSIATKGDIPDGTLTGSEPVDEGFTGSRAVSGNGGDLAQEQ